MFHLRMGLCLAMLASAMAKIGFIKDQSMDWQFPGPVFSQDKSLPDGHMRPLGWQRRPDAPVKEEEEMPASREFFLQFVEPKIPVVFRNGVREAPAFTTWEDDTYLSQQYGHINVTVTMKVAKRRDKVQSAGQVMKMKKFLYDYMYDELYLASVIPTELMDELPLPKCVRCGSLAERLISSQLWMSSGGTSSRVHSHDHHLLHCVLFGRRDFIVINGAHKYAFDFVYDFPGSLGGHSDIDTDRINAIKYKAIAKVPWTWSTLQPGDCIFIPAGYLHQVRSYGRSVSITVEFSPPEEFDDTGCVLVEEEFVPLSQANYMLSFKNGELRLADPDLNPEKLRSILMTLTGPTNGLTEANFANFYHTVLGEESGVPPASRVFAFMTSEERESRLTQTDLAGLSPAALQKVTDIFNSAYGNTQEPKPTEIKRTDTDTLHRAAHDEM